ncbi:MAG: ABC transporter permease [Bacteroidota bacterium]
MFFHHLLIAWRHLNRNKVYGLINLAGLSIGIASVLLISLYVHHELSFDKFFQGSERIYRVALHRVYPDRTRDFASSPVTLAPVLKEYYPEVEAATRVHRMYFMNDISIRIGEQTFVEPRVRFADADFFEVFSHTFLHGDPATALDAAGKIVLTESTAMKYFGKTDVLNETLGIVSDTVVYLVSAVIRDIPVNSHLHFDVLGSIHSIPYLEAAIDNNRWMNPWLYTYVKLRSGVDAHNFEEKFDQLVDTYGKEHLSQNLGLDYQEAGHRFDYFLQALEDIHLYSKLDLEAEPTSNIQYIYLLALIAFIILFISSINYVNLSVARSPARAKEVGIRKVMGVSHRTLIWQFLAESILLCSISAGVALILLSVGLPYFNGILHTSLSLQPLYHPSAIVLFLLFIAGIGTLSGFYPATVIAGIRPSRILQGTFKSGKRGRWLRNGLTTLQFVISIVMISGSILIYQQMRYFRSKDLGFNKENILVIPQAGRLGQHYQAFRNEVASLPHVQQIGGANGLPGDLHGSNIFKVVKPISSDLRTNVMTYDDYFFETLQFRLVQGRSFGPSYADSAKVMINEATMRALGVADAVGVQFQNPSNGENASPILTVIGVVEDYHYYSLHTEIGPLVIFNGNNQFVPPRIAIRLRSGQMEESLRSIQAIWRSYMKEEMNYSFLDQQLAQQYESDRATGWVFDLFTYIAILMCCGGLFGLTTYIAQQRSKEMGIRKVLGASIPSILLSFSREFLLLIGIASLIGMPIGYWVMSEWLSGFAYHVEISFWLFLFTGLTMLALIMLTVSYQSIRLARTNPVESLKSE